MVSGYHFYFEAQIGYMLFDKESELYLPGIYKDEESAENYIEYAKKLKEILCDVIIGPHQRIALNNFIEVRLYLFGDKKFGEEIVPNYLEIIVDRESRLLTFSDISQVEKEVQHTVEKIKQYIYDMEIIRMHER